MLTLACLCVWLLWAASATDEEVSPCMELQKRLLCRLPDAFLQADADGRQGVLQLRHCPLQLAVAPDKAGHTAVARLTCAQDWPCTCGQPLMLGALVQVPTCAKLANEAVEAGMAAVIGLQSTGGPGSAPNGSCWDLHAQALQDPVAVRHMLARVRWPHAGAAPPLIPNEAQSAHCCAGEANTKSAMEESHLGEEGVMDDFVSAPAVILTSYIKKWLPTRTKDSSEQYLNALQAQARPAAAVCQLLAGRHAGRDHCLGWGHHQQAAC